ncbi:MAG: MBL fold metallo-hydrolase [Aigarchaeota archaeon]|nr:MBL fold metallo-hydrolase [Aigarchaeota archaeon]MCX8192616.1 MBL fold metallo-hydrolase [Nitrososphaeria archaeon]MDW7985648.1 MBL fold metallo-hydrolase [Nitrososphaerota archaeon]
MLIVERIVVGPLMSNSYLVFDPVLKEGILIDAGDESEKILKNIERNNVEVKAIYATHGHFDHILAVGDLKEYLGCKFYIHKDDLEILGNAVTNYKEIVGGECPEPPKPDDYVEDGDKIIIGSSKIEVLHTPGHTAGSVSYVLDGSVFTGDTLFAGAIGRYDLPGGSLELLLKSLNEKILILPENYSVYPGHGPSTTIGVEKFHNPFIGVRGLYRRDK